MIAWLPDQRFSALELLDRHGSGVPHNHVSGGTTIFCWSRSDLFEINWTGHQRSGTASGASIANLAISSAYTAAFRALSNKRGMRLRTLLSSVPTT